MARAKSAEAVAPATESITYDPESFLRALKEPVDPSLIKQREGWRDRNGNVKMVDYIEWHSACEVLDNTFIEWSHSIKDIRIVGDFCCVVVALTVAGVTREGLGTGKAGSEMGLKKAEHDALKRAAVKFGIARELYHKEEGQFVEELGGGGSYQGGQQYGGGGQQYNNTRPADPYIRDGSQAPTSDKPGKMLWAICNALGLKVEDVAGQEWGVPPIAQNQLNKQAISYLIDKVKAIQNQQQGAPPPIQQTPPPMTPVYTGMVQPTAPVQPQAQAVPPMPPPPQPASTEQGQLADINTVNSLKILCNKKNVDPVAIASQYSGGRASKPEEMSQAECVAAHDAVAKM